MPKMRSVPTDVAKPREIVSVSHAVRLIGTERILQFASLIMLTRMGDKPRSIRTSDFVFRKVQAS
jgi:hypothetical protein